MKNNHGASLYYASDKNIFDALCGSKVNSETIQQLFLARNIIVSRKTDRQDLASYFSRLPHDFNDHQNIAAKLGVIKRKERTTSVELKLEISSDELSKAIKAVKTKLEQNGDVVHLNQDIEKPTTITVKYSSLDYRKSEFSQVQIRDGEITLIPTADGYKFRSTCNDHMNNVRDGLILEMEKQTQKTAVREEISLFAVTDPTKRSDFFQSLMFKMPNYKLKDVHEVYVYKKRPFNGIDENGEPIDPADVHVERVALRGNGVSRSKQLINLTRRDEENPDEPYYIVRAAWLLAEEKGTGQRYEIEARFEDHLNCTGFSFMLRGVYRIDALKQTLNKTRHPPTPGEVDTISTLIEEHAKILRAAIM